MQDDGGSGIAYDHEDNLYVAGVFQGTNNVEGQTLTGEQYSTLSHYTALGRKTYSWPSLLRAIAITTIAMAWAAASKMTTDHERYVWWYGQ
jgi:hypothetical protein